MLTNDEFIKRSNKIHNRFYNYVDTYKGTRIKIKIICPIHGEFEQMPYSHLQGIGCPKCGFKRSSELNKKGNDNFKDEANLVHNNYYNYDKVDYKNNKTKIIINCPKHGDFEQTPLAHIKGHGCSKCAPKKENKNNNLFIEEANLVHKNKYIYNSGYRGAHIPIIINCPKHGDFKQTPNSHLRGRGCPDCQWSNSSRMENDWLDILNIDKKYRNKHIKIDNKIYKFDAYIEETNTIYEFYGDYWHGNPNKSYNSDLNHRSKTSFSDLYTKTIKREEFLKSKGYNIISIWEYDYIKQIIKKKYNK